MLHLIQLLNWSHVMHLLPSQPFESAIQVSHPSQPSESAIRVSNPIKQSNSPTDSAIRVCHASPLCHVQVRLYSLTRWCSDPCPNKTQSWKQLQQVQGKVLIVQCPQLNVTPYATSGALASSQDALQADSDLRVYRPCHQRDCTAGTPELIRRRHHRRAASLSVRTTGRA